MAENEERLWSVTTLIGAGLPKEALIYWAANVTSERAYDDLTEDIRGRSLAASRRAWARRWRCDRRR